MAKEAGMGCALDAGGYDVGGDTQAFTVHGGPVALDLTDVTQSAFFGLGGERSAEVNWTSFMDTAAGAEHDALSGLPLTDQIETVLLNPVAVGCPALSQVSKQIGYDPTRGADGSLTFALSGQSNAFGQEWGVALTPGRRVDVAATAAGPSNSFDTGASLSFGAQMYVHLIAFAGTSVTIKLQDSADNITFLDIAGTSLTTTALTAGHQAVRVSEPNTTVIRRYIAVATVGTFTSADFVVQVTKNPIANVVF